MLSAKAFNCFTLNKDIIINKEIDIVLVIVSILYLNAVHVLLLRLEILRKYGYDSCAQPVF